MYQFQLFEKEIIHFFYLFLILFNLVSLYFIIDLLFCDEIVGYFTNGETKIADPHNLAWLFLINGASNLFFISVSLMFRVLSKD